MQLEFVNVSGAEPWKNEEVKKFVRSHAMKDFRRRQRESAAKDLVNETAQSRPAFNSNDCVDGFKPDLRDRPTASARSIPTNRSNSAPKSTWVQGTQPLSSVALQLAEFDSNQVAQEFFPLLTLPSLLGISNTSTQEPQEWQWVLQLSKQASVGRQLAVTFDARLSILVDTVLNTVEGGFCNIVTNYLKTTHTWLCMIPEQRLLDHLAKRGTWPNAEFAIVFLAMYLASPVSVDFSDGKGDWAFLDEVYRSVKELHRMRAANGPCFSVVVSGILIALYEIWHADHTTARSTLHIASSAANALNLDSSMTYALSSHPNSTSYLEERKRVCWSLIIIDRLAALAHPPKRDRPLVVRAPETDVLLPTTVDDGWSCSEDFDPVAGVALPVLALIPSDADVMCREAQAAYFLGQVYDITSQEFTGDHRALISKILKLDQDIQRVFAQLLSDSEGSRFCGPISMYLCSLFILHWSQLRKARNHSCEQCQQVAIMSQLALEKTVQLLVDILHNLQPSILFKLSPAACFSVFQGAMLYLELVELGEETGGTMVLDQSYFDLIYDSLKLLATVWHCCTKYLEIIDRRRGHCNSGRSP